MGDQTPPRFDYETMEQVGVMGTTLVSTAGQLIVFR